MLPLVEKRWCVSVLLVALAFGAGCAERREAVAEKQVESSAFLANEAGNPFDEFARDSAVSDGRQAASAAEAETGDESASQTLRFAETTLGAGRVDALHEALRVLAAGTSVAAPRAVREGWEVTLPARGVSVDQLEKIARGAGFVLHGELLDLPLVLDPHRTACGSCGYALFQRVESVPGVRAVEVFLPSRNQLRVLAAPGAVDPARVVALAMEGSHP